VLQRLLLLPLLLPLLAVLLLGAINPRPATSLRLLIWTSPTLPIGLWITAAAAGGAALSAGATALALKGQSRVVFQRQRRGLEPGAQPERRGAARPPLRRMSGDDPLLPPRPPDPFGPLETPPPPWPFPSGSFTARTQAWALQEPPLPPRPLPPQQQEPLSPPQQEPVGMAGMRHRATTGEPACDCRP
jgi:uncharacterized integral membrane protein